MTLTTMIPPTTVRLSRLPLLFALCTMLASCVNDIPYDAEIGAPRLVLNALLLPDSTLTATVSRTTHFLEYDAPQRLADATVTATVNGTAHLLTYASATQDYHGAYRLRAGDEVTLTASHALGTATASQTVSHRVPLHVVSATRQPFANPGDPISMATLNDVDSALHLTLHIDDPADEANYYRLTLDYSGTYLARYPVGIYGYGHPSAEPHDSDTYVTAQRFYPHYLFTESSSRLVTGSESASQLLGGLLYLTASHTLLFTDEQLRHPSHRQPVLDFLMLMELPRSTHDTPDDTPDESGTESDFIPPCDTVSRFTYHYSFMLETLSADYYHYLTTTSSYAMTGNGMLAEPVRIHSNVSTGFGIVGSYVTTTLADSIKSSL